MESRLLALQRAAGSPIFDPAHPPGDRQGDRDGGREHGGDGRDLLSGLILAPAGRCRSAGRCSPRSTSTSAATLVENVRMRPAPTYDRDAGPCPFPPGRLGAFDLDTIFETAGGRGQGDRRVGARVGPRRATTPPPRSTRRSTSCATGRRRGMKSRLGRWVRAFYERLRPRLHLGAGKTAFIACEGGVLEEGLLRHAGTIAAAALAATWKKAGIEPGASACLRHVLPLGVEHARGPAHPPWRMGLTISTLPPHGPTYVANRSSTRTGLRLGRHQRAPPQRAPPPARARPPP